MITHTCPRCHATLPVYQGWHLHQCPDPADDDTSEWEKPETEEGDE